MVEFAGDEKQPASRIHFTPDVDLEAAGPRYVDNLEPISISSFSFPRRFVESHPPRLLESARSFEKVAY